MQASIDGQLLGRARTMVRLMAPCLLLACSWASPHEPTAPWLCADARKRRHKDCINLDFTEPYPDDRPAVDLRHMDPAPARNMSCCGLPEPVCDGGAPPPLSCLEAPIPFGEPPACVRRRFKCCLAHWMGRFGLDKAYAKKDYVSCKGRLWDVADVTAEDVIFDARSLLKIAAAFVPRVMLVYEEAHFPEMDKVDESWHGVLAVIKLGFGWYQIDRAPPDALILAHNLVHDARLNRTAPALELPRGVKKGALWADHCEDGPRPIFVRCAGFKLHRGRVDKFQALRAHGVCNDPLARHANHLHTGMLRHEDYAKFMFQGRYVPSMPGVGWENYRDTEAVVAGAVPILEDPPLAPQRPPFHELLDELPHIRIKNETAWGDLTPAHLPEARPAGDARKHFLPYWLHAIFAQLLAHGVENATAFDVAPPATPGNYGGHRARPSEIEHFPYLDPNHVGCRWADPPVAGEKHPSIMH